MDRQRDDLLRDPSGCRDRRVEPVVRRLIGDRGGVVDASVDAVLVEVVPERGPVLTANRVLVIDVAAARWFRGQNYLRHVGERRRQPRCVRPAGIVVRREFPQLFQSDPGGETRQSEVVADCDVVVAVRVGVRARP